MFSRIWKAIKDWHRRNSDADYAYLNQATDLADLEWRLQNIHYRRPTYPDHFYWSRF